MYIIQYNDFVLQNGDNYVINRLDGISRVGVRTSQDLLTGGNGGNIWERKLEMRTITIGGYILANDFETYYALREALAEAFFIDTEELLTITRSDGVSRSINAKVVEIPDFPEVEGEFATTNFSFILKCEDPFFFDNSASTGTIAPGVTGGSPVPTPVPSPLGGTQEKVYIVNEGDVDDYPEIVITGQITNAFVYNETTGESFEIETTLNAGETLRIYYNQEGFYVLKDGINYMQYFSGTFFKIIQGTNVISFNGSNYNTDASLTVTFNNKYRIL